MAEITIKYRAKDLINPEGVTLFSHTDSHTYIQVVEALETTTRRITIYNLP